jgi:hypothetical protein
MKTKGVLILILAVILSLAGSGVSEAIKKKDRCDLIVKSLSAPSSANSGSRIRIFSRVKNKGKSTAKKSYIKFYLSKNSKLDSSDEYLGRVKVESLKKKKTSKKHKKYVHIPELVPAGRYYIIAKADGYNKVKEKSEKNNYRKRRITINSFNETTISIEPESAIVAPGQATKFIVTITGSSNTAVTWNASAGEIIEDGKITAYIAPDAVGEYTLTATSAADVSKSVTVTVTVTDKGVMLDGEPDVLAKDTVTDLLIELESHEDEISIDDTLSFGSRVLRTDILVEFSETATVGEVNTLLSEINGAILGMTEGLHFMIVRIPDPVTIDALNQIIVDVESRPFVEYAIKSLIPETHALPSPIPANNRIDHHLAVRAHAAWNIKSAIPIPSDRPLLFIIDSFGAGPPNNDFNTEIPFPKEFGTSPPGDNHGYFVLGIISGFFGKRGVDQARGDVTGIFPEELKVRAIDEQTSLHPGKSTKIVVKHYAWIFKKFLDEVRLIMAANPDARIVLNTSFGYTCPITPIGLPLKWIETIRNLGEDRIVHITSAGNYIPAVCGSGRRQAEEYSPFSYAAFNDIQYTDKQGKTNTYTRLNNIVVVENRVKTAATITSRPMPGCAYYDSIMGGTLSAIGHGVHSFTVSNTGTSTTGGTSFAAPQVAGLAAYIWSLKPSLTAQEVIEILQNTAKSAPNSTLGANCNQAPIQQNVIDAYDAVLAAGGKKARLALLDIVGSGTSDNNPNDRFDEVDLEEFDAYYTLFSPTILAYLLYDLNGDGFIGGTSKESFDLDNDGSFGVVKLTLGCNDVSYDESALTDLDILCYYAYEGPLKGEKDPLYEGDLNERNAILGKKCGYAAATASIQNATSIIGTNLTSAGCPLPKEVSCVFDSTFIVDTKNMENGKTSSRSEQWGAYYAVGIITGNTFNGIYPEHDMFQGSLDLTWNNKERTTITSLKWNETITWPDGDTQDFTVNASNIPENKQFPGIGSFVVLDNATCSSITEVDYKSGVVSYTGHSCNEYSFIQVKCDWE